MKKLLFITTLFLGVFGVSLLTAPEAKAANAADFNPGYIIDDYVFYNSNAMNTSQIQNFLESKNPVCDYWGTGRATDWGYSNLTRAQLAEQIRTTGISGYNKGNPDAGFHAPPYKCLPKHSQATPQLGADSSYCNGLSAGTRTAAQIINDVAKSCGINPQVLIILLEKEQSLVTDIWPLDRQLRNATGFACPDTAPCDPAYEGFFYQVYHAARQFKVYQAFPNSYNYRAGVTNNIYWHPDLGRCGSSSVYIQNQATAALYIYTPYRPNQAALNNLYGTGDSCSSYGNRNFWRVFTDWFGSTKLAYRPLDDQRWMQLRTNTHKLDIFNNTPTGPELTSKRQIFFIDKVYTNGKWYLRTEYDKANDNLYGIALDDLEEIPVTAIAPKWISIPNNTPKVNPFNRTQHDIIEKMTASQAVGMTSINGVSYYRTAYDNSNGNMRFIPVASTEEFKLYPFDTPRLMTTTKQTERINARTNATLSRIPSNSLFYFSHRITIDGILYAQATTDTGSDIVVRFSDLKEIDDISKRFVPLDDPRWMQLISNSKKVTLSTNQDLEPMLSAKRQIRFIDKIFANNQWYLRTEYDTTINSLDTLALDDLEEIPITAIAPKWVSIPLQTKKIDPLRGITYETVAGLSAVRVVDSLTLDGSLYYRTAYESNLGRSRLIPASATENFTFYSLLKPRELKARKNVPVYNVQNNTKTGTTTAGTKSFFNRRITIDGTVYLQPRDNNGTMLGIREQDLGEV